MVYGFITRARGKHIVSNIGNIRHMVISSRINASSDWLAGHISTLDRHFYISGLSLISSRHLRSAKSFLVMTTMNTSYSALAHSYGVKGE